VLEQAVETHIAGLFRLRVQPAEIGRQLERAMLNGRTASMGSQLAPNTITVRLHPEDAATFAGWEDALEREMERWLAELVYARGLATVGSISVTIQADAAVPRRSVRVTGSFAAGVVAIAGGSDAAPRLQLKAADPRFPSLELGLAIITVGRADDNDLMLPDPEVSRHHAQLAPDEGTWRVVDLGSTNGTWVNGTRVTAATIAVGDRIAFAGVRMTITPG
jgi:hypothetical protein